MVSSTFPAIIALLVALQLVPPGFCGGAAVIFNFGDSNSDTGGAGAVQGWLLGPPIGRLLVNSSGNGRLCDGRLVIDFLCESLNIGYLSPYLDSVDQPDFSNGADFAVAGASVLPRDRFFSLNREVDQFLRFKSRSLELVAKVIDWDNGRKEATVKSPLGDLWNVEIHREEGTYCFGKGWPEFAKAHNLEMGYLVIFRYEGEMTFSIKVFDVSGCIKCYTSPIAQKSTEPHLTYFKIITASRLGRFDHCSKSLITEEGFRKAIYMIDIGQNDFAGGSEMNYDKIVAKIPSVLSEMEVAIKIIYDNGAAKFWIHNTGPFGCLPAKLSSPQKYDSDLDPYGCLISLNNAAKKFNDGLSALCDKMSSELKNVSIVYTDIYAIKYDIIAHSAEYSFESPVMACCGYGGPPYNYNESILCGNPESKACSEGSRYISWDGVHYTEAANTLVASNILSTNYSKPRVRFDYFCNS